MKFTLFNKLSRAKPRELVTFRQLSEDPHPFLLPSLDRPRVNHAPLTPIQREWRQDGVVILRGFLPNSILDPYIAVRTALDRPVGWSSPTPYLQVPELRALALHPPLMAILRDLIGEEMMLHLCLTGWISTERDWHQDDYLNPGHVNSWYLAVWIALDTISPDSGPFEYIPGSHRWRLLRQAKVRALLSAEENSRRDPQTGVELWPKLTESFVAAAIETEIRERAVLPVQFLADKGDVLIWHSRLMHRGSLAEKRFAPRKALITHYSGVNHRPDMSARATDENGMTYALFDHPLQ
jgi:hypothetical protein